MGGSSSINGMVYVRGHAEDFNQWEERGAKGWAYKDCLPYFKRSESWHEGENDYRGGNGPVSTSNGNNMKLNPLYEALLKLEKRPVIQKLKTITENNKKVLVQCI